MPHNIVSQNSIRNYTSGLHFSYFRLALPVGKIRLGTIKNSILRQKCIKKLQKHLWLPISSITYRNNPALLAVFEFSEKCFEVMVWGSSLTRHGREIGNGKTGTGKGCRETGKGNGERLFFPVMVTDNDHFSRREFPFFSRPEIWFKNN